MDGHAHSLFCRHVHREVERPAGQTTRLVDVLLAFIGMIVICFGGIVVLLLAKGQIDLGGVMAGLVPDFTQFTQPAGDLRELVAGLSPAGNEFGSID